MQVQVVLHSVLRERLPRAARGRATLDLPASGTVADALVALGITFRVLAAVNRQLEADQGRLLADGDELELFPPAGGGAQGVS